MWIMWRFKATVCKTTVGYVTEKNDKYTLHTYLCVITYSNKLKNSHELRMNPLNIHRSRHRFV